MLWGCFAAGGTGALYKIDGIMIKEKCGFNISTYISRHQLKLGQKCVFQMDNNPKHTSKVVAKWLKDNKVKYWSGHYKALTSIL